MLDLCSQYWQVKLVFLPDDGRFEGERVADHVRDEREVGGAVDEMPMVHGGVVVAQCVFPGLGDSDRPVVRDGGTNSMTRESQVRHLLVHKPCCRIIARARTYRHDPRSVIDFVQRDAVEGDVQRPTRVERRTRRFGHRHIPCILFHDRPCDARGWSRRERKLFRHGKTNGTGRCVRCTGRCYYGRRLCDCDGP